MREKSGSSYACKTTTATTLHTLIILPVKKNKTKEKIKKASREKEPLTSED